MLLLVFFLLYLFIFYSLVLLSRQVSPIQATVALKLLLRFVVFDVICVVWSFDSRTMAAAAAAVVLFFLFLCRFNVVFSSLSMKFH